MSVIWNIADSIRATPIAAALSGLDACFALRGKRITTDLRSYVSFHQLDGHAVYLKRYTASGKYLRKFLGRSRVRAEWENLLLFRSWGIPTPELLAYGEEKRNGKFIRGALATAAIAGAADLEKLAAENSPLLFDRVCFRQIAAQVARYTRAMHEHGFAHNDLDWRNILVTTSTAAGTHADPVVYFFDCPGGRFWIWPFLEYRVMKDLAHLDKIARHCLPLRWRLWFYRQYTGRRKLTAADKRRLRKIATYYDRVV